MKIGIDARICSEDGYYSRFVYELIEVFVAQNTNDKIAVYTQKNLPFHRKNIIDDIKVKKLFESEKFHLMIFFDYHIPHGYKGEYIVVLESLKEVFFPKKQWFKRKLQSYRLKKSLASCKYAITLDHGSAMELNENLNIHEDTIRSIPGFFPTYSLYQDSPVHIDIKKKHNLSHEYLIYDSGNEVHNNFDRILKTIKKLGEKGIFLQLIVLCEETTKDIDIRNKVLEYGVSQQTLFLGNVSQHEEQFYYTQSLGVIFSSIYESFPFHFTKAIVYNCNIFANDIPANRAAMGDKIHYLDPLSIHNMCDVITHVYKNNDSPRYNEIQLSPALSADELVNILQEKN